MKRVSSLLLAVSVLLPPGLVLAVHGDVVVVRSSRLQPYEEALTGFRQAWEPVIPRRQKWRPVWLVANGYGSNSRSRPGYPEITV